MKSIEQIASRAREVSRELAALGRQAKDAALLAAAAELRASESEILAQNAEDCSAAAAAGMREIMLDRLRLDGARIESMAQGIEQVAALDDPTGEFVSMSKRPNGMMIGRRRVPLGVVGMIYESRPNVTADAFCLCFKTGNASILRGGRESLRTNVAIVRALRAGIARTGVPEDALQYIEDTDHERVRELMHMNRYVDVLIPRGGAGLISSVVQNSSVPVIETGIGNCHVYVDESADIDMAVEIIDNAKTQRMSVCNACESLLVHEAIAERAIPPICERLLGKGIEIRADDRARALCAAAVPASEEDWGTEYLDAKISLKVVASFDDAVAHINRYGTGHSDAIVTTDYARALEFQERIDSAAVYVNASTRFTDGGEFGFGAEIGISTQKLHARGPMGLDALTTTKFVIFGSGQVRA